MGEEQGGAGRRGQVIMITHLLLLTTLLIALSLLILGASNKFAPFLNVCKTELSIGEYQNVSIASLLFW